VEPPEEVRSAWQGLAESWDDTARHQAFLALVTQHSCFAWAASRYKERAGDAIADQQLDRLRRAATATLMATAAPRAERKSVPYLSTMIVIVALVALAVSGVVCTKMIRDSQPTPVTNSEP
jgi:hypothetical protein